MATLWTNPQFHAVAIAVLPLAIVSTGYAMISHVGLSRGKPLPIILCLAPRAHSLSVLTTPYDYCKIALLDEQISGSFKMEYALMFVLVSPPELLSGVDD